MKYVLIYSIFFVQTIYSLNAQNRYFDDVKLLGGFHYGLNIPEYQMFTYVTDDYVRSVDFSVIIETNGKNDWEQIFNYPEYGVSLFYSSLGNDDVFGREFALIPFFRTNIIYKKKFKLYNQIGVGLSYVNKKFDSENNYLNVAVGSHVNLHFNLRFGMNYELNSKISVNMGVSFDHFSNANTSEPNLGINCITAFTGLSYSLGNKTEKRKTVLSPHSKENYYSIITNIGGKYSRALSSKKYITSSISFEAKRKCYRAFHLGLGVDLFYDSSVEDQLSDAGESYHTSNSFQTGIHFSQTVVYNRLSLSLQEGVYIGLVEKVENYKMYNRGIIAFKINERCSIRLAMKSHLHILDYPEFGVSYNL